MLDIKRLEYRNQFLLAPYILESLVGWQKIEVATNLKLSVHPDLEVTQYGNSTNLIILLGYALDPNKPENSNFDIIVDLYGKIFEKKGNYFEPTFDLGGRWILLIKDTEDIIVYTDPAGLRQVVYCDKKEEKFLCCASQQSLLTEKCEFKSDREALNFAKFFKEKNSEYFMPGDTTTFREIRHLLPNHYLILNKKKCNRYWPKNNNNFINLKEASKRCSLILKGLMTAAANRFDLCLSLSGGLDSRLLLSASKDLINKITFITEIKENTKLSHPDVKIPKKIMKRLHAKHEIIDFTTFYPIDQGYCNVFNKNFPFAHDKWMRKAAKYFKMFALEKVDVIGTVVDIGKLHYHKFRDEDLLIDKNASAIKLAELLGVKESEFGIRGIADWLRTIKSIYNYNLLDIFYWELRVGRWAANNNLEFDCGWNDIFVPYNCRTLLEVMLSTDKVYREGPKFILNNEIINILWPEMLLEPINPRKEDNILNKTKKRIKKVFKKYILS